jgi:hypothetical protein
VQNLNSPTYDKNGDSVVDCCVELFPFRSGGPTEDRSIPSESILLQIIEIQFLLLSQVSLEACFKYYIELAPQAC